MKARFLQFAVLIFFTMGVAFAGEREKIKDPKFIDIKSDLMFIYSSKNITVFKGNVTAVADTTTIKADELTVYSGKSQKNKNIDSNISANSFEKIEAKGNVIINFKDKTAKAGNAIYIEKEKKFILTGNRPILIEGENKIEGDKIIYNIEKDVLEVKPNKGSQVKAVFTNE